MLILFNKTIKILILLSRSILFLPFLFIAYDVDYDKQYAAGDEPEGYFFELGVDERFVVAEEITEQRKYDDPYSAAESRVGAELFHIHTRKPCRKRNVLADNGQ